MASVLQKPAVIDPQSKLAKGRADFTRKMNSTLQEGRELGATEGMQRLELICEQYDQLSPNTAYLWIDPNAIQYEIEEAQIHSRKIEVVHFFRNFFSLAPLIATWLALFFAVYSYQQDLLNFPVDRTRPFLELWQIGFRGAFYGMRWLTFTTAAGTDVVLLALLLTFILLTHELERRAHIKAVNFVKNLQNKVDELMQYVAEDGFKHTGDQSDIDKVVDAVKKVVDSATASVKQAVEGTTATMKQVVEQTAGANKQVIEGVEKSFKSALTEAQQKMQKAVEASEKAITASNSKVDKMFTDDVAPLMKSFRSDMTTFQQELGKYQTRLNDLTNASQQLADASQKLTNASTTLTDNAERYSNIGQNIETQIASLNMTQKEVVSQIGSVANNISTAAGNMTSITASMKNATTNVEVVAKQLNVEMQTTLQKMTINVDSFTQSMNQGGANLRATIQSLDTSIGNVSRSLEQVGADLRATSSHLYNTAMYLEASQRRSRNFIRWISERVGKRPAPQRGPNP